MYTIPPCPQHARYMHNIPQSATVGVTRNPALKENVFAIIVCIQTHIPVIIVGPPGSTKTLSFQIVRESVLVEPMVRPGTVRVLQLPFNLSGLFGHRVKPSFSVPDEHAPV
jgi:hypothetical protein